MFSKEARGESAPFEEKGREERVIQNLIAEICGLFN
jgi:hypothetical protein